MIDLIDESSEELAKFGYNIKHVGQYEIDLGVLCVDSDEKSQKLGFNKGEYVILNSPLIYDLGENCHDYISKLLGKQLSRLLKSLKLDKKSKYLIVGIGNPDILADSLGKMTLDKININILDEENNIFKLCPNIYLNTGVSTFEIVYLLAVALDVDAIILIDSLATRSISRLGVSFQLNTNGITPGSAMHDKNKRIDRSSTGLPCISFGVPFMIFASDICDCKNKDLVLAPKDIHENIDISAKVIATAINLALKGEK